MRVQIQKWGNSLAFRIPKVYAKEANMKQGSSVDLSFKEGQLVLKPLTQKRYSLRNLLSKINKDNIHKEQGFGPVQGKEVW